MALTTAERLEVVGILQQKEIDLREEVLKLMVEKWTEELETRAARVRKLWNKMEYGNP